MDFMLVAPSPFKKLRKTHELRYITHKLNEELTQPLQLNETFARANIICNGAPVRIVCKGIIVLHFKHFDATIVSHDNRITYALYRIPTRHNFFPPETYIVRLSDSKIINYWPLVS